MNVYATCYIKKCVCGKVVEKCTRSVDGREPIIINVVCSSCAWKTRYAKQAEKQEQLAKKQKIQAALRVKRAQHRYEKELASKKERRERHLQTDKIRKRICEAEVESIREAAKTSTERYLITAAQASRALNVSKRTIYYWIKTGKVQRGTSAQGTTGVYADSIVDL